MKTDDFLIIGAGPASTSAALALVRHGHTLRMVDAGGAEDIRLPPPGAHRHPRMTDRQQWRWQIGGHHEALEPVSASSPKLRIAGLRGIFDGYAEANRIQAEDGFQCAGALAAGGLSNAWGCGVAAFGAAELPPLDIAQRSALRGGYERAALRMGLSGANDDAIADELGLDGWAGPPLDLDELHERLWRRRGQVAMQNGLLLGRARVAVLREDAQDGRLGCDYSGMCLWGCARRATWSARRDVEALERMPGVEIDRGMLVERLVRDGDAWRVECTGRGKTPRSYRATRVLLGAGTLASTRLALAALERPPPAVRLLSNPMAAFLLLCPGALGRARGRSFGLAQLSFLLRDVYDREPAFGNLFSTAGLPVSEFLSHLPITRRAGLPLLRALLPAAIVGNVFLPGSLSAHTATLDRNNNLHVAAGAHPMLGGALQQVRNRLRADLRRLGGWMLPGSFVAGAPGADLHYAGTLPMRTHPMAHECHSTGEIAGLPGVYAIDGASLALLPAKPHTLTIMANADRIASGLD